MSVNWTKLKIQKILDNILFHGHIQELDNTLPHRHIQELDNILPHRGIQEELFIRVRALTDAVIWMCHAILHLSERQGCVVGPELFVF